jgi:nucleoside-triphosphatase THEP1
MVFVCGEYGAGKTSMLKKIINEFRGRRRVIYYNCNQKTASIDFDRLLINAGGFFSRLFRVRKKNMILLLDESSDMNMKDIEMLKQYYQDGFLKSVVFVSKVEDIKLIREIDSLVGKNKYMIRSIDKDDAVKLIRKRIGDLKFVSDEKIAKIFSRNRNPRAFLMNCEDVCRYAFERGASKVSDEHIETVLG